MCKNWAQIQSSQGCSAPGSCVGLERPLLCTSLFTHLGETSKGAQIKLESSPKAHSRQKVHPFNQGVLIPSPLPYMGPFILYMPPSCYLFSGETKYFGSNFIPCLDNKYLYNKIRRNIHDNYFFAVSHPNPQLPAHTGTNQCVRPDGTLNSQKLTL